MSEPRAIRDGPFAWQSKTALRKIRDCLDREGTVASGIAVYTALTEISSDEQSANFVTTQAYIAQKSGVSVRTVSAREEDLKEIGLLKIDTPALKAPSRYSLLSVLNPLPNDLQPLPNDLQRTEKDSLHTSEQNNEQEKKKGEEGSPPFASQNSNRKPKQAWQLRKEADADLARINEIKKAAGMYQDSGGWVGAQKLSEDDRTAINALRRRSTKKKKEADLLPE